MRRHLTSGVVVFALLAALGAGAETTSATLGKAQALILAGAAADALKLIEDLSRREGNDRETTLRLLELQGAAYAGLKQNARALRAFQAMLCLEPERQPSFSLDGRAAATMSKAKAWAAQNPRLELRAARPTVSGGKIFQIAAEVPADSLKLSQSVRFHVRVDGHAWSILDAPLYGKSAAAGTEGSKVEWWAELLGEREAVLSVLGSASAPRVETPSGDAPLADAKAALHPRPDSERPALSASAPSVGPLKPAAYGCLVASGVAVIAGSYFGLQSAAARRKVDSAATDESGRVTGLTQVEALQLGAQARSQAMIANGIFIGAGALAAAGGVLWYLGDRVVVAPAGNGVAVAGTFP